MEYFRLLYELPAVVAASTMLAFLSPWQFRSRFAPLIMFLAGLLVLMLPEFIDMALCITIPAAWLQSKLGIDMHGHEPLKLSLPVIRLKRAQVKQFVTSAFTDPDRTDTGDDMPLEPEPERNCTASTVQSFVPPI